jgi:hypothetical protein
MLFDNPMLFDQAGEELLPHLTHKITITPCGGDAAPDSIAVECEGCHELLIEFLPESEQLDPEQVSTPKAVRRTLALTVAELLDELKPPLQPQAAQDSTRPVPPPGPRWCGDRGAMPDEPTYFLDGDPDTAEAAITPREVSGNGLLFEVLVSDGRLLGTYDDFRIAAAAAEYAVDHRKCETSIWSNLQTVILTLQYCLETLEQTCACGRCDPCTRGQEDIRQAIRTVEDLLPPGMEAPGSRHAADANQDGT